MKWPAFKLSDIAQINPKRSFIGRKDDEPTSFIPMEAVDDVRGEVIQQIASPFLKIKKGYTYFENGDIIFAKITPCMQNGKHAVLGNLIDGFGFGSTEFHVIRPSKRVIPEWIHYFLRRKETLDAAFKTLTGAVGQQRVPPGFLIDLEIPVPPIEKQRQIAAKLKAQLAEIDRARQAAQAQLREAVKLADAIIFESIRNGKTASTSLGGVLQEISNGVGESWADYQVLGATRDGLAPAKEPPGKKPQRYKPVFPGTVFYNPMRILIGSIAMVDDDDTPGITSPDYVALKGKSGLVDSRWFYYWLRSSLGKQCILSLARGAVRERMLFNRLAEGKIDLPSFKTQQKASMALAAIKPMRQAIEFQLREIDLLPQKILAQAFEIQS